MYFEHILDRVCSVSYMAVGFIQGGEACLITDIYACVMLQQQLHHVLFAERAGCDKSCGTAMVLRINIGTML